MEKILEKTFSLCLIGIVIFSGCAQETDIASIDISKEVFGQIDDKVVFLYTLKNENGIN